MTTNIFEKTLHSIKFRKISKPIVICISALFIISMLSALTPNSVQAATTASALHTQGASVVDANGNVIYLRGMGVAGFAPDLILWDSGGGDSWGEQWNSNPATVMDQTFSAMQTQWHINMIRVFILPSWYYRDNIAPSTEDSSYSASTPSISTRTYLQTLCGEAAKYGIYVDIVPYMLTPPDASFGSDPYATTNFGNQGLPMMGTDGWDAPAKAFLKAAGYGNNEQGFWQWFWTDMANNLKNYPNAIFEAWNEPGWDGGDTEPIPAGYMSYMQTMYSAIRATGSTNLIFMQWHMGWIPNGYGATLGWASDINKALNNPTNIVYTTHFYYYAPSDLSSYWAKDYATLKTQIQNAVTSMGVSAPLVINEEGSCLSSSPNKQNDYTWWQNLVLAQRDLGVGAGAYYWLSDQGLGGAYSGESLLSSGYSPNTMGQSYINAYNGAPTATPAPTASPSPTPKPTATPTANPSPTPKPTASPTPTATPALTSSQTFLFKADFETGSFSEYTATNGAGTHSSAVEKNNPYLGAYDAKYTAGASSESWSDHAISSSAITYYSQYVKVTALPASGTYLCLGNIQNTNSQNTVDAFIYNRNGQYYWGAVSSINGVSYWDKETIASNPKVGTYYNIELCRDVTNHKTNLWIDGTQKINAVRSHVGNSNIIYSGITWTGTSATVYVDNVRVSNSYIS